MRYLQLFFEKLPVDPMTVSASDVSISVCFATDAPTARTTSISWP